MKKKRWRDDVLTQIAELGLSRETYEPFHWPSNNKGSILKIEPCFKLDAFAVTDFEIKAPLGPFHFRSEEGFECPDLSARTEHRATTPMTGSRSFFRSFNPLSFDQDTVQSVTLIILVCYMLYF